MISVTIHILVGYKVENFAGQEPEAFSNTRQIELLHQDSDCPSCMH